MLKENRRILSKTLTGGFHLVAQYEKQMVKVIKLYLKKNVLTE